MYMLGWPPLEALVSHIHDAGMGVLGALTAIRDPEPSAVATFLGALGHIGRDIVPSLAEEERANSY